MRMITNLFSVFDPSSRLGLALNWLSLGLIVFLIPLGKWVSLSRGIVLIRWGIGRLYYEIKALFSKGSKATAVIFRALFIFIIINNIIGLFPYVYTATRHLVITLSIAFPLWIGYFRFGWVNNLKWILAHLIPQGTPWLLIPFIVVIERVRRLIRPGTLAVRLIANIIAGHLLLVLVRGSARVLSSLIFWGVIFSQILLVVLEVAVAIIQAYVLVILRVLYSREV